MCEVVLFWFFLIIPVLGRGAMGGERGLCFVHRHRAAGSGVGAVELAVDLAVGQQLVVGAGLDDEAVVHHADQVGLLDRRQPVRHRQRGPALADRVESLQLSIKSYA